MTVLMFRERVSGSMPSVFRVVLAGGFLVHIFYQIPGLAMQDFAKQGEGGRCDGTIVPYALQGLGIDSLVAQPVIGYAVFRHVFSHWAK